MTPRAIAVTALVVVAGAIGVLALTGGEDHHLTATFAATEQLAPGQELRIAGRKIGEVGKIELVDGNSVVELKIMEDDVWPLKEGTTAGIRWGSTTSLAYRYMELHPAEGGKSLEEGDRLPLSRTETPVELDTSYRIFRGRTRGDLRNLVTELGDTFDDQGPPLRKGLAAAPGGLDATAEFLGKLGDDRHRLETLVRTGDRVTTALAGQRDDLSALADHAAATFDEFAQHTTAEQEALDRAPQAFNAATTTLARLDTSLVTLRGLMDDLGPGAVELRRLATPLRASLSELRVLVKPATTALKSGTAASPGLNKLLGKGAEFLPQLGRVLDDAAPMFACLRPYAPELAGNMGTWTAYNKNFDNDGHYARTFPLLANPGLVPGTPFNSQQITQIFNDGRLTYAMPRPPGLNAGKPWFLPECGAGPESVDPTKDPEGAGK